MDTIIKNLNTEHIMAFMRANEYNEIKVKGESSSCVTAILEEFERLVPRGCDKEPRLWADVKGLDGSTLWRNRAYEV